MFGRADAPHALPIGNRRYGRFGNLRYGIAPSRSAQMAADIAKARATIRREIVVFNLPFPRPQEPRAIVLT